MQPFVLYKNQPTRLFYNSIIIIFLLFLVPSTIIAQQTDYFWNNNTKVYLNQSTLKKYITFNKSITDTTSLKQILNLPNASIQGFGELSILSGLNDFSTEKIPENNWAIIENKSLNTLVLTTNSLIFSESTIYLTSNNEELSVSHLFYVKLHTLSDFQILHNFAQQNKIKILGNNKYMPLWHTLSCDKNSVGNALQMANLFHEKGLFAIVQPDFMVKVETSCTNDSLFVDQWGLENTGQYNPAYTGIDINLCQAHQITTGNNNVVVAVIDRGVEKTHPDLTNIYPESFNIVTGTSPSVVGSGVDGNHGTNVAGIIGANSNNNIGITGIAPSCPIMVISNKAQTTNPNEVQMLANGISFAWKKGADVINNSWALNTSNANLINLYLIEDAFTEAMTKGRGGLGCVVVAASANGNSSTVGYPARFHPDIIAVGAISPCGERWNPNSCSSTGPGGSNYGEALDIVAPGIFIPTTDLGGGYNNFSATSSAAPHVAGVAALILSVNPGLSQQQVSNIIETTAQKVRPNLHNYQNTFIRPNGTWHEEVGYGLIDAYAAVLMAQSLCTTQIDLFTKDSGFDFGEEPNTNTGSYIWLSEDIWVRNLADGFTNQVHESPTQSVTSPQPAFVYVRIINKSCEASLGTDTLSLHWAKAATSLTWPLYWNGNLDLDSSGAIALAGDLIGSQIIPIIPAGGDTILEFTWITPLPDNYSAINSDPWHFCLLSRILSSNDPMTFPESSNLGENVRNNNNIAWKNITVITLLDELIVCDGLQIGNTGTVVAVANPDNQPKTYDIMFTVPEDELNLPITKEGKVMISFEDELYKKWIQGGKKGSGFNEILNTPMSENGAANNNINANSPVSVNNRKSFELTETIAIFKNITLDANEYRTTSLTIQYPTDINSTKKEWYNYDIVQKRSITEEVIGGVRYTIQKPDCNELVVDAGENQFIKKGCSAALVATPIVVCSSYKWYDNTGKLIAEEPVVKITPNKTTTYTLKFVSKDGCTGEDQVKITVLNQLCKKEKEIIKITPNPASDFITIDYKALNTNSAQVRLLKTDNSIDRTYQLDLQNTQKTINISDCNFGSYILLLVCDGVNEDSEIVIIQ